VIERIGPGLATGAGDEIDADGLTVLPGVVDTLCDVPLGASDDGTPLARISGEAAAWGCTTLLLHDPADPATSTEAHRRQLEHAARSCRVHFGVYTAADPGGAPPVDTERTPGIRAPLGLSRGRAGLGPEAFEALLAATHRLVVVEGQDPKGTATREALYAGPIDPVEHSSIYVPELAASVLAWVVAAVRKHGGRVHAARVSSAAELAVLADADGTQITAQATLPHLFLRAPDAYRSLGVRAVCEPPLRGTADVAALWAALVEGRLTGVASGHGSVRREEKERPYPTTPTAIPTVGAALPLLLQAVHEGRATLPQVARWTAEAPARLVGLERTGRIEVGYDADLVLVDAQADVTATPPVPSWSGWTPFEGVPLRGRPIATLLRGRPVFRDGRLVDGVRGRELTFT
jgi:dihydroorotase